MHLLPVEKYLRIKDKWAKILIHMYIHTYISYICKVYVPMQLNMQHVQYNLNIRI